MASNRRPLSFNFSFGTRKKSQGAKSGKYGGWGITAILFFRQKLVGVDGSVRRGVVMVKQADLFSPKLGGDVFARFHAVAAKLCSRTRNSQFGLLGQILCAQSP